MKVYSLGDCRIETASAVIEPRAKVTFAAALYLALERSKPTYRGALKALLWPDATSVQASHRLRQTLLKLRQLGLAVGSVGREGVQIEPDGVWVDYENWSAELLPIAQLGHRQLLPMPGYGPTFSSEFSSWLDRKQAHILGVLARGVLHRIAEHRYAGEWPAVEACARSLLELTPLNEEATLALAECLAMRGAKHSATNLLSDYLDETGTGPTDLRLQATVMRRRIVDHISPRAPGLPDEGTLVGRSAVMRILAEVVQAVRRGRGDARLLLGAPGIGKSRMASDFSHFAALQGLNPVRIDCRPGHKTRPLSAFVDIVPVLLSMPGALGCSPETLSALDRLIRYQPGAGDVLSRIDDPEWVFSAVQRALLDLVDAIAHESPLLILIEDIHWMDDSSLAVLGEVIECAKNSKVMLILTARDLPDAWQAESPRALSTIDLDPLSETESSDLILGILRKRARRMDATYLAWCVNVAEGNPYFLAELTNHWIETGIEHEVPPSLSTILRRRIERLTPDSLHLLQTCALLENSSTLSRIEGILEHDAHDLLTSLDELGAAQMIVTDSSDSLTSGADRILTRHELLSSAALMELSAPARRFLHRRIAKVLEAEIDEQYSTAVLWDSAKHWQMAGDYRRAWNLATSCAYHLMAVGLPNSAAQAYTKSVTFCTTDAERLEVLKAQTVAYYRMSAWEDVSRNAVRIRQIQNRLGPEQLHDDVELMDLRAQWQTLDWNSVLEKALKCLHAPEASPAHRAEAGVMALMLQGFQVDRSRLLETYDTIAKLIKKGSVPEAISLQANMVFHTNHGDLNIGVIASRQLVEEQRSHGDVGALFRAHCNAAVTCRVAGLFDEAEESFAAALMIAEKHKLLAAKQRAIPLVANMALEMGKIADVRRWHNELSSLKLDESNALNLIERQAIAARIALFEGRGQDALALLPFTFEEACIDPVFHRRTYNLALHVCAELVANGSSPPNNVAKLSESFRHSRSGFHQAFSAFVLVTALRQIGNCDEAELVYREYTNLSRREPWPAPQHLLDTIERMVPARISRLAEAPVP